MDKNIRLLYDKEADVIYVTSGNPKYTEYEEIGDGRKPRIVAERKSIYRTKKRVTR